jgi:hypothetical protein
MIINISEEPPISIFRAEAGMEAAGYLQMISNLLLHHTVAHLRKQMY